MSTHNSDSWQKKSLLRPNKRSKMWKRHEEHMSCWKEDKSMSLGFDYICFSIVPPLSCRVHYIYTHAVRRICSLALLLSYSELERVRSVCSLPELEIVGNRVGTWLLICKCDPTWERDSDKQRKRERCQSQYKRRGRERIQIFPPVVQWKTVQCLSGFTSE